MLHDTRVRLASGAVAYIDRGTHVPVVSMTTTQAMVVFNGEVVAVAPIDLQMLTPGQAPATPLPFRTLFDGMSLSSWRGSSTPALPSGVSITGGILTAPPGVVLITRESFDDFELELEWKVAPGGNGGIFYRIKPGSDPAAPTGVAMEMQLQDDEFRDPFKTGSLHGVKPRNANAGGYAPNQWRTARLVVRGTQGEHYVDGSITCRFNTIKPDFRTAVLESKAPRVKDPAYGTVVSSPIGLQFYHGQVWYRNIRIRPLGR